jgi:hypothetical protein
MKSPIQTRTRDTFDTDGVGLDHRTEPLKLDPVDVLRWIAAGTLYEHIQVDVSYNPSRFSDDRITTSHSFVTAK